jgi:hypothetical protein
MEKIFQTSKYISSILVFFFFCGIGFELRASHLQDRCSTT